MLHFCREKAMAPHSSTLAWKIPWMEEPGRLQSMGSLRVGHDWTTSLSGIGEGNGNPLQCSCLENPRDGEPDGLPSMGLHRVRHDWSDLAEAAAFLYTDNELIDINKLIKRYQDNNPIYNQIKKYLEINLTKDFKKNYTLKDTGRETEDCKVNGRISYIN